MRLRGGLGRHASDTGSEENLMVVRDRPVGKALREAAGTRLLCDRAGDGNRHKLVKLEDESLASLAKTVSHPTVGDHRR